MNRKRADRRPDEKPAEQGQGEHDPSKPESGRRMPKGHPFDKQAPKPGTRGGGMDILDGDRSDRESGRPIQLGDDDESETFSSGQQGQTDAERGLGGRPQEGEDRKPYETEKARR